MNLSIPLLPLGGILLMKAVLYFREFEWDSGSKELIKGLLILLYIYMLIETSLLLLYKNLNMNVLIFEFFFYVKFLFLQLLYIKLHITKSKFINLLQIILSYLILLVIMGTFLLIWYKLVLLGSVKEQWSQEEYEYVLNLIYIKEFLPHALWLGFVLVSIPYIVKNRVYLGEAL